MVKKMAKEMTDEMEEVVSGAEAVDRTITVTVKPDGTFDVSLSGEFNVVELYHVMSAVKTRIDLDYISFMEQTLFSVASDMNKLMAAEEPVGDKP